MVSRVFLPAVAVGITLFAAMLALTLPNRTSIVGWNVAWAGFDLILAGVILATWIGARRGAWWSIATAGALTALQVADVWWSLTVYYSLREMPFMVIWAFVIQPLFAIYVWRFVLRQVEVR